MNHRVCRWAAIAGLTLFVFTSAASAADHRDGPIFANSARFGSQDLNDVYVFRSPANVDRTVLIMTVNPFAGVLSPTTFEPGILYDFCIDKNGDAVEDIVYRYRFYDLPISDTQFFIVQRLNMNSLLGQLGIGQEVSVGVTGLAQTLAGGGRTLQDNFDDPFFFDLNGFQNGFQFTGDDFFEGANVSCIVLELPTARLVGTGPRIGVWCRTLSPGIFGFDTTQIDRNGRPAINTVLIPANRKTLFNRSEPIDDQRRFRTNVIDSLLALGRTRADAEALADVLLPDILTVNTNSGAGFLNGRRLADDVIDIELDLLTGGEVTTDGVDRNDRAFRRTFPYLAPPHVMPGN